MPLRRLWHSSRAAAACIAGQVSRGFRLLDWQLSKWYMNGSLFARALAFALKPMATPTTPDFSAKEPRQGVAKILIEAVYAFILAVTLLAWAVIGLVVWVPLLVRTTTLLAASVLYASLFRDDARISSAERAVNFAVRFYLSGFEHFVSFYRNRHNPETPVGLLSELKWRELLVECLWVVVVWAIISFIVHEILATFTFYWPFHF